MASCSLLRPVPGSCQGLVEAFPRECRLPSGWGAVGDRNPAASAIAHSEPPLPRSSGRTPTPDKLSDMVKYLDLSSTLAPSCQ